MKYQIDSLLIQLKEEGQDVVVKTMEKFSSILDNTITEVKRMQQELRPSMLDDLGLVVTIGWLCRKFHEINSGVRVDPKIDIGEKEVPGSLKLAIFRILQEALTNAAKHSKASRIHLSLGKASKDITLTISDNGQGFNVKEMSRKGLGMVIMREQAELSGGSFAMESVKGKGTTVRVTWPV